MTAPAVQRPVPADEPTPVAGDPARGGTGPYRPVLLRLLGAAAAGVLLWAAFPRADLWPAAVLGSPRSTWPPAPRVAAGSVPPPVPPWVC